MPTRVATHRDRNQEWIDGLDNITAPMRKVAEAAEKKGLTRANLFEKDGGSWVHNGNRFSASNPSNLDWAPGRF